MNNLFKKVGVVVGVIGSSFAVLADDPIIATSSTQAITSALTTMKTELETWIPTILPVIIGIAGIFFVFWLLKFVLRLVKGVSNASK